MRNPVIVLAFANPEQDPLPSLNEEADQIQKTLQGVEGESQVQTVYFPRFSLERIVDTVQNKNWTMQIFHFAGHAEGQNLQLTDTALAFGSLGRIFADRFQTQIVFLNGCGTMQLVAPLLGAGIPVIIATKSRIADKKASVFSRHFYDALAAGQSLMEAFELASDMVRAQFPEQGLDFQVRTASRNLSLGGHTDDFNQWDLIVAPGREEMLKWRLFDYRRRRRMVWWMRMGVAAVLVVGLLGIAAWGFLREQKTVLIAIRNAAGKTPPFEFPAGFFFELRKGNEFEYVPIQDWDTNLHFPLWLWESPEYQIHITKNGVAYSDSNRIVNPSQQQRHVFMVFPIQGKFSLLDTYPVFPDSLQLNVSYEGSPIEENFSLYGPDWEIGNLLMYRFLFYRPTYLDLKILHPQISIAGECPFIPPKPFLDDEKGFGCLLRINPTL